MIDLREHLADLYCDDLKVIRQYLEDEQFDIDQMCDDYTEPDIYYKDLWAWLDKMTDGDLDDLDNALTEALEQNPRPNGFFDLVGMTQAIYRRHYFYEDRDDKLEYIAVYYLVKVLGITEVDEDELKSYVEAVQREDGCGEDLADWKECYRAHFSKVVFEEEEEDDS